MILRYLHQRKLPERVPEESESEQLMVEFSEESRTEDELITNEIPGSSQRRDLLFHYGLTEAEIAEMDDDLPAYEKPGG